MKQEKSSVQKKLYQIETLVPLDLKGNHPTQQRNTTKKEFEIAAMAVNTSNDGKLQENHYYSTIHL